MSREADLRDDLESIRSEILSAIENLEPVLSKIDAIEEEVVNVDCVQRENYKVEYKVESANLNLLSDEQLREIAE